jgi:tripartite-type tricarboxylate transporter receptor subunit TctC
MNNLRVSRRALLLAGSSVAWAQSALAQVSGSSKVVKMIVGFPPGQATDMVTRVLAERLRALTGDNYIVENRPGQGGSLALSQLAKSPANGSTMMIAHMSAAATNPHIYASVGYDTNKDFEAVGLLGDLPFVLVCNPALPVQNLQELIAYAKANPDKLNNASSGNGTVSHLAMEEIKRKAGLKVTHIPYKGSVAGLTDVISGNVSMALETASAVRTHVESGRLRALAAGSAKRLGGVLANVPTLMEQGFQDFTATTWLMALYPAGTPKPIIEATYAAISAMAGQSDLEQKLMSLGLQPRYSKSPDEAANYLRSEYKNWGDIVKRSGIQKEM